MATFVAGFAARTREPRGLEATTLFGLGLFAVVEMVLFIVTVFVAYFYVLRRGGLDWD